jgi:hypothetical protein
MNGNGRRTRKEETMTTPMKAALAKLLKAHNDGLEAYAPVANVRMRQAMKRAGLIQWGSTGYVLTPAGVDAAERLADEAWGIGGDWIPTGETLEEIVARDMSHRRR